MSIFEELGCRNACRYIDIYDMGNPTPTGQTKFEVLYVTCEYFELIQFDSANTSKTSENKKEMQS